MNEFQLFVIVCAVGYLRDYILGFGGCEVVHLLGLCGRIAVRKLHIKVSSRLIERRCCLFEVEHGHLLDGDKVEYAAVRLRIGKKRHRLRIVFQRIDGSVIHLTLRIIELEISVSRFPVGIFIAVRNIITERRHLRLLLILSAVGYYVHGFRIRFGCVPARAGGQHGYGDCGSCERSRKSYSVQVGSPLRIMRIRRISGIS